jgi:hypothetical protein
MFNIFRNPSHPEQKTKKKLKAIFKEGLNDSDLYQSQG